MTNSGKEGQLLWKICGSLEFEALKLRISGFRRSISKCVEISVPNPYRLDLTDFNAIEGEPFERTSGRQIGDWIINIRQSGFPDR